MQRKYICGFILATVIGILGFIGIVITLSRRCNDFLDTSMVVSSMLLFFYGLHLIRSIYLNSRPQCGEEYSWRYGPWDFVFTFFFLITNIILTYQLAYSTESCNRDLVKYAYVIDAGTWLYLASALIYISILLWHRKF